jgi:hypothetical protein
MSIDPPGGQIFEDGETSHARDRLLEKLDALRVRSPVRIATPVIAGPLLL